MKYILFRVTFTSGGIPMFVWAVCEKHAVILAQAERIKHGLSYEDYKAAEVLRDEN